MNWNFRGIYPHKKPDIFYGQKGLSADTGNPLPSATLTTSAEAVTTPGDISITAYAVNTVGFQWQTSADGEEWVNITGQISKTLERFYPHIAGTAGTYYYRVLCAGWLGVVPSPAVSVTVSYAIPSVSISVSAEFVPNAGMVMLSAEGRYVDTYSWQVSRDGVEWVSLGINSPEATIDYAPEDGGEYLYRCEAVGLGGTVYSVPVKVDVEYHVPEITISADMLSVMSPGAACITATATYADSYEWEILASNGIWTYIQGGPELSLSYADGEAGIYQYRCHAIGKGGRAVSESVTITVTCPPPTISIAADALEIESPGTVTITATSHLALGFSWEVSRDGESWETIADATEQELSITYADGEDGIFSYRCTAYGNGGETMSDELRIIVSAPVVEEPEPETPEGEGSGEEGSLTS